MTSDPSWTLHLQLIVLLMSPYDPLWALYEPVGATKETIMGPLVGPLI